MTTDGQTLCVYGGPGVPDVLYRARVTPGGTCATKPCWTTTASGAHQYKNALANPDGVVALKLVPGADGKAQIKAKLTRPDLLLPLLPVALPVTVQRRSDTGACWTASHSVATKNTTTKQHQPGSGRYR